MANGLAAPTKGTATKASDPQHRVLAGAMESAGGYIRRGKLADGRAPSTVLLAMAKRDFVRLDMDGFVIKGAWITELGARKRHELDAAEAERQRVARAVRGF